MANSKSTIIKITVAIATVAVLAGSAFGVYKFISSKKSNEPSKDPKIEAPTQPTDPTPSTPTPTPTDPTVPTDPTDPTPVDPKPETPDVTEEEYKQKFLSELPQMIEESYNSKVEVEKLKLKDIKVLEINAKSGNIYVNCTRNNHNMFYVYNKQQLTNFSSFEDLYNNFDRDFGIPNTLETALETSLANEVGEFALQQDAVREYIAANVGDYSEYTVLNATEFNGTTRGAETDLVVKFDDKIVKFSMACSTGAKSSQEAYFDMFKNSGREIRYQFDSVEDYAELSSQHQTPSNAYDCFMEEIVNEAMNEMIQKSINKVAIMEASL